VKRGGALAMALAPMLLWQAEPAAAGHGMMTSFAAIEWLPEPGRTPDELFYFLDTWSEERALEAASGPREALEVCLRIAREKLAELEAMVRAGNAAAARVAADRYGMFIQRALASLGDPGVSRLEEGQETKALVRSLCRALLEHQYILSVDYETLPRETRKLLTEVVAVADGVYRRVEPRLSPHDRDPLLFAQNEVRWSVQAGMRDD